MSAPSAESILSTEAILSLSLNLSWGAPYSLLVPSAVLRRTATMGNRSGMSERSTSAATSLSALAHETLPPTADTSHPALPNMSSMALSPCGSFRSRPSTDTFPDRPPTTRGKAAEEKSAGTA